jgi:hypothetical protein
MDPANVDPVECARLIVYAARSAARAEAGDAPCTPYAPGATRGDLSGLAGDADGPYFPPNIALTLVCVLCSVAVVAWSVATQ